MSTGSVGRHFYHYTTTTALFGDDIDQKQGSKASILDLSSFVAHLGSTLVVGLGEKLSTSFSILHYNETFET